MTNQNTMTLKTLLEKYFVIIPDYQRAYAQGPDNPRDRSVLAMFTDTILSVLEDDNKELSLDYVYGNIQIKPL